MFAAIIGTPSAGKQTILDYFVQRHGFKRLGLEEPKDLMDAARLSGNQLDHIQGLSIHDPTPRAVDPVSEISCKADVQTPLEVASPPTFPNAEALLDYATRHWLTHHVTTDLRTYDDIEPFLKRPFFMLLAVDGPLRTRFERESKRVGTKLEQFIDQHDLLLHGPTLSLPSSSLARHPQTEFRRVLNLATLNICNNFPSVESLYAYLDQLDLMDEERLRPGWDTYFMTLASLASHRSNCMKRRVGALLVRSKRILSTGYNGTPRGVRNCNQGGCTRCNGSAGRGEGLAACLCLHAEENALLEAGRDRIGDDAILYCNTCPCLTCSVKIVQSGVKEVVYNQSYSMDAASAMVLKEGGVVLRQLVLPVT